MKKIAMDPRSVELIKKFLTGGALLGGGAGIAVSLANYLKSLKADAAKTTDEDDDTLYINIGGQKRASALVGPGLAVTGGMLSTAAAYTLVRKAYQQIKKKKIQREIDDAQSAYINLLQEEGNKAASQGRSLHLTDLMLAAPVSVGLLTALLSGVVTNQALTKNFPQVKKTYNKQPKRVVVRNVEEDEEKEAAFDDAMEHVFRTVLRDTKRAAESGLGDMVSAVVDGRFEELEQNYDIGADALTGIVKGASTVTKPTTTQESLAISALLKSARLGPSVRLLVASEFYDMAPSFCKIASTFPEDLADAYVKVAAYIGAGTRQAYCESMVNTIEQTKQAGSKSEIPLPVLLALLSGVTGGEKSQPKVETMEDSVVETTPTTDDASEGDENKKKDIVDEMLA